MRAHDRDVRRVLAALGEHKLVADQKKCKFFVKEVEFCGHILGGGKRRPAPGKLMALEKWEPPEPAQHREDFRCSATTTRHTSQGMLSWVEN